MNEDSVLFNQSGGLSSDYGIDPITGKLVSKKDLFDYSAYNAYPTAQVASDPVKTTGTDTGFMDTVSGWFKPNEKGFSSAGSVMDALGTGTDIVTGLAGLYYQDKMAGLAKDKAAMEKDAYKRQVANDEAIKRGTTRLAQNVGNGASYIGA